MNVHGFGDENRIQIPSSPISELACLKNQESLNLPLLKVCVKINEMNAYQFNYHLSYQFRYWFSCF